MVGPSINAIAMTMVARSLANLGFPAAQISIVQNLTYFEHLSEPMAEFLHILAEQYDYPQLGEEVLRELSNKEFNSNDTRGPKSVSTFMVKLSELAPRLVIKQMTMLAKQLDSEVGTEVLSAT